ncbi:MAG: DUF1028 domain-containing protein [Alphaproteobacteria bacterium]|nr:DUF1028 domain-containing protein [Alphaproteobacteria bacterium]
MEFHTFSIVGRCARTGQVGVAVASAGAGVGPMCIYARARVGAVSTQSWCNPYLALDGLDLMEKGLGAQAVCEQLLAADPGRDIRQIGYVDAKGGSAAYTGAKCADWKGHLTGPNFAAQGNLLIGARTVEAMAESFVKTEVLDLADRLIRALEAGQAGGGDARGKQGAAVMVMGTERYPLVDLRADEHRHAVIELRRIYEVARHQSLPFVAQMPSRDNPHGTFGEDVRRIFSIAPAYRPGGGGGESL